MSEQPPRMPRSYRTAPIVPGRTEWDRLIAEMWRLIGQTRDPLIGGATLLTTDGGSEHINAELARRRSGMEPHE
jgi:hypothetical protein